MRDYTCTTDSNGSIWSAEQVLGMAAVFLESFTGRVSKILEILGILEFPENQACLFYVPFAPMDWRHQCGLVHVFGSNKIYGNGELCEPKMHFWS